MMGWPSASAAETTGLASPDQATTVVSLSAALGAIRLVWMPPPTFV
jgi:hypothetical protein